jgi:hypothetical protein
MSAEMIQMGINAIIGIGNGYLQKQQIKAENMVNEANTIAANLIRKSGNELSGAKGSLARFNQSVNNSRVLAGAGDSAEVALVNYRRARDNADKGDFESQIAFAEQRGGQQAAAAASGLVGGVVDVVNSTTALRQARIEQASEETLRFAAFDAAKQQGDIIRAGIENMDNSSIIDGLDYTIDTYVEKKRVGNLWTDINGNGQNTKMAANVLNSFATQGSSQKFTFNAAKDSQAANI